MNVVFVYFIVKKKYKISFMYMHLKKNQLMFDKKGKLRN